MSSSLLVLPNLNNLLCIYKVCILHAVFAFINAYLLGFMSLCASAALSLPDGACGRGQRRAKCPDVLFVLLHCGNADFEGGNVGQKRARG